MNNVNCISTISENMHEQHFNYNVNISMISKYIYFGNPKVASSTILNTLQSVESRLTGVQSEKIHDRENSPLLRPKDIGYEQFLKIIKDDSFLKFSFVRNPYSRVLSCYRDKIIGHLPSRIRFTKKFNLLDNFGNDDIIPLSVFLGSIRKQQRKHMDSHWRPQTDQILFKFIEYQYIGKLENFNQEFQEVLKKIYPHEEVSVNNFIPHKTNSCNHLNFFDETSKNLVRDIYKEDFENFNYPLNLHT